MKCPFCGFAESKVIDSRPTEDGGVIRRRRECIKCQERFTTYEKLETISIAVVKKDKSVQPFDNGKILKGLIRACEKRPVSISQMEDLVRDIETQLQQANEREISSAKIGDIVLERLKNLDQVAYIRFASVYKRFDDVDSFLQELNQLKG